MVEPHQRTQSRKLRKPTRQYAVLSSSEDSHHLSSKTTPGLANATALDDIDYEEVLEIHRQTPTPLTDNHVRIMSEMARGYGCSDDKCIDKEWRRTRNIGIWHLGTELSISANIMQPNIHNSWAKITSCRLDIIKSIAKH